MAQDEGSTNLDFMRAAREAAAAMKVETPVTPTGAQEDERIIVQIDTVARVVAAHEILVTAHDNDGMFEAARARREAEAELNRLITARVNSLAAKWKDML